MAHRNQTQQSDPMMPLAAVFVSVGNSKMIISTSFHHTYYQHARDQMVSKQGLMGTDSSCSHCLTSACVLPAFLWCMCAPSLPLVHVCSQPPLGLPASPWCMSLPLVHVCSQPPLGTCVLPASPWSPSFPLVSQLPLGACAPSLPLVHVCSQPPLGACVLPASTWCMCAPSLYLVHVCSQPPLGASAAHDTMMAPVVCLLVASWMTSFWVHVYGVQPQCLLLANVRACHPSHSPLSIALQYNVFISSSSTTVRQGGGSPAGLSLQTDLAQPGPASWLGSLVTQLVGQHHHLVPV